MDNQSQEQSSQSYRRSQDDLDQEAESETEDTDSEMSSDSDLNEEHYMINEEFEQAKTRRIEIRQPPQRTSQEKSNDDKHENSQVFDRETQVSSTHDVPDAAGLSEKDQGTSVDARFEDMLISPGCRSLERSSPPRKRQKTTTHRLIYSSQERLSQNEKNTPEVTSSQDGIPTTETVNTNELPRQSDTNPNNDGEEPNQTQQIQEVRDRQDATINRINTDESEDEVQILSVPRRDRSLDSETEELLVECKKRPYLDGKFYDVDIRQSSVRGTIFGICQLCTPHKTIKGSLKWPSNFIQHLKKIHADRFEEYTAYKNDKKQRTDGDLSAHGERGQRTMRCKFSQRTFDRNVTDYILDSMAPFRTVEMPSFRKIFDDFQIKHGTIQLQHMSRRTLGRRIDVSFTERMDEIRKAIDKTSTYVCTTADIWTSRTRRIMGVTVHWIEASSLERKSAAIACRRFPNTHSAENIAALLSDIHESYGLNTNRIVATVTDNGSNFVKAFRVFGISAPLTLNDENSSDDSSVELSEVDEEATGPTDTAERVDDISYVEIDEIEDLASILPRHLRCGCHTLHLIATTDYMAYLKTAKAVQKAHTEALDRCSLLWKAVRYAKTNEIVRNQLGRALLRPVITRWNSLYDALAQIIELEDEIAAVSDTLKLKKPLRRIDFKYLKNYLDIMKPLAATLDKFQGEVSCYYGYFLPAIITLRYRWRELLVNHTLHRNFEGVLEALIGALTKRFESFFNLSDSADMAVIAAVTHPQFKNRWLAGFSVPERTKVENLLVRTVTKMSRENRNEAESVRSQDDDENDDFFMFGESSPAAPDPNPGRIDAHCEYIRFINDPRKSLTMLNEYPIMKKVFIKYNTPLPSSAPVERLFSVATTLNLPKCNRLTNENFEKRVLAKANAGKPYL